MVKPFTPQEIASKQLYSIPNEVIEAVNELLAESLSASSDKPSCTILQDKIVKRILAKLPNKSSRDIFDNNWLDFEPIFEAYGWKVVYDKPAYNENYEASFNFESTEKVVRKYTIPTGTESGGPG